MKNVAVPARADARGNLRRVMEAAEVVFSEGGSAGSTGEVARRAGLGVGTVFRHFPTKQALIEAIVINRLMRLVEAGRDIVAAGDADGFYALFAVLLREVRKKRMLHDPMFGPDAAIRSRHAAIFVELAAIVDMLIARGKAAGLVRPDLTTDDVALLLIGAHYAAQVAGPDAARQLLLVDVLMAGLRPRG